MAALALGLAPGLSGAQEALILGGMQHADTADGSSYGYAYVYQHNLAEHWYASFTYLNEGHIPDHHRDGHSAQIWWRYPLMDRKLTLAVGVGPYRYFDTTNQGAGGDYNNRHGWGALASVAITWYVDGGPWMLQARYNRAQTPSSIKTNTWLLGVGYQLDRGDRPGPVVPPPSRLTSVTGNELTVMVGAAIVNSFDSPTALAKLIEFRHGFGSVIDGTLSYIDEGETSALRRHGVAAQAWLNRAFFKDRFTLGLGLGPYYAIDVNAQAGGQEQHANHVSGLLTASASYRISARWLVRVSWNRSITGYDRDTDVLLAGIGYRF